MRRMGIECNILQTGSLTSPFFTISLYTGGAAFYRNWIFPQAFSVLVRAELKYEDVLLINSENSSGCLHGLNMLIKQFKFEHKEFGYQFGCQIDIIDYDDLSLSCKIICADVEWDRQITVQANSEELMYSPETNDACEEYKFGYWTSQDKYDIYCEKTRELIKKNKDTPLLRF